MIYGEIISKTPEKRQTIMFSATMDKSILEIAKKYQNNPKKVDVTQKQIQSPKILQIYFEVLDKNKTELLARLIDIHNIKVSLVFCNTKNQVNVVVEALKSRGYFAEGLHGDLNQSQREKVMNGF
jgi:ATP-dependent RNA helicase DeaD